MTREQIEQMEAGPAMDAAVAERVMGWKRIDTRPAGWPEPKVIINILDGRTIKPYTGPWFVPPEWIGDYPVNGVAVPPYSTSIEAAWPLFEAHTDAVIEKCGDAYEVELSAWMRARAATAPLAICRAALAAVLAGRVGA